MCRNITTLRGLEPAATPEEIEAAARQFVRKISGVQATSAATEQAFEEAVRKVTEASEALLAALRLVASPRRPCRRCVDGRSPPAEPTFLEPGRGGPPACDAGAVGGPCLVLDFDGTILDTEQSNYLAWAELWRDHGHDLDLAAWQRTIGAVESFDPEAELETRLGRPIEARHHERRRQHRDELHARLGPRPGVRRWLDDAAVLGLPVGIASSSPVEWVEGHLDDLGLRPCFVALVCRRDGLAVKPAPDPYLTACQELGADPGRSVAVEDSPHGVTSAVAAGLFTVAVPHELTRPLDFSVADVVVDSLADFSLAEALARAARRA